MAPLALWLSVLVLAILVTCYSARLNDLPKTGETIPSLHQSAPPADKAFPALDDIEIGNLT